MNKVNRKILLIIVACAIGGVGCGNIDDQAAVADEVNEFFHSDYEYTITCTSYVDGKEQSIVYKGQLISDPYEEYVTIENSISTPLWTEAYYYGQGEVVLSKLKESGEWIEGKSNRKYPYGYGEKLDFCYEKEEMLDDHKCKVYSTKYEEDVNTHYSSSNSLIAVISQEYYLDTESGDIVQIVTDLEDLNQKTYIANEIQTKGISQEEAESTMKEMEDEFKRSETMRVYYPQNEIKIEIDFSNE